MADIAIGIDLGTTNSCIAVWRDGKVEIIPNHLGKRTTPSYVAFTDTGAVYGDDAKKEAAKYPATTIYDAKRLIGRRFSDPLVQGYIKLFPFKVINDFEEPKIEVNCNGATHQYAPEEISAMILSKLKDFAETYLGTAVTDVVVTVPANFSDSQRRATKSAGDIAGLNVLRIINEPMAAAIAYGLDKKASRKSHKKVLVFDLGGGTLDVCIIVLQEEEFIVKAVTGRTDIGGRDFDKVMVNHLRLVVKQKYDKDISSDQRALRRLRTACEGAKKDLSEAKRATIEIEPLVDGIDFEYTITREEFVGLNLFLFNMCMDSVENCLNDARMSKEDIDDVVLVGGSTRIPYVRKMLQDFFGEEKISAGINPDEAVAYGAAIHAAMLSKNAEQEVSDLVKLVDVTPLSLGVEAVKSDGTKAMVVLIQKNTRVPVDFEKTFTTERDWQRVVKIVVLEGEGERSDENLLLDKFELQGIPPARSGETRIIVRFAIDAEGILSVTARVAGADIERAIKITSNKGKLSQIRVEKVARDIEYLQRIEAENNRLMAARNSLQEHIQDLEAIMKNMHMSVEKRDDVSGSIRRAIALKNQTTTTTTTTTTEVSTEYEKMTTELEILLHEITVEHSESEGRGLRLVTDEDDNYPEASSYGITLLE